MQCIWCGRLQKLGLGTYSKHRDVRFGTDFFWRDGKFIKVKMSDDK